MAELEDGVTRGVPGSAPEGGRPRDSRRTLALRLSSAAHEVDDFQLVAFGEVGVGPLAARDDVAV